MQVTRVRQEQEGWMHSLNAIADQRQKIEHEMSHAIATRQLRLARTQWKILSESQEFSDRVIQWYQNHARQQWQTSVLPELQSELHRRGVLRNLRCQVHQELIPIASEKHRIRKWKSHALLEELANAVHLRRVREEIQNHWKRKLCPSIRKEWYRRQQTRSMCQAVSSFRIDTYISSMTCLLLTYYIVILSMILYGTGEWITRTLVYGIHTWYRFHCNFVLYHQKRYNLSKKKEVYSSLSRSHRRWFQKTRGVHRYP